MKTNLHLLNVLVLLNLLGCQKTEQSSHPLPKTTTINNQTTQGPSDGGGGDTCNGKMIESYRVDITQLDEYKQLVTRFGNALTLSTGADGLIDGMAKYKNWYLIDCALDAIPQERKGLYLKTDQTALHTGKEVFINSSLYSQMNTEEKSKLLLHEILMGVYLIKYKTINEMCEMDTHCDRKGLSFIKNWKSMEPEPYRPLDETDHQNIRNATIKFWESSSTLSSDNAQKILSENNFDKRFTEFHSTSIESVSYDADDIIRLFKRYEWTNSYPIFCNFDETKLLSQSNCKTTIQSEILEAKGFSKQKTLSINLKIERLSDHKILTSRMTLTLDENQKINVQNMSPDALMPFNHSTLTFSAQWPYLNIINKTFKEGDKSVFTYLTIYKDSTNNLQISQIVFITTVWYSIEQKEVIRNGQKYYDIIGYSAQVKDETETIYFENTLPYDFSKLVSTQPSITLMESSIPFDNK